METISIRVNEGTRLAFDLSPDGRRIIFDLLGQLWELDANGGEGRALTDAVRDTANDLDPSWAPDGQRVVFEGERSGRTGLWLLERDTSLRQLTQLPDPDGQDGNAAWSPDGRTIAFSRRHPRDSVHRTVRSVVALLDVGTDSIRELAVEGLPAPNVRDPAWEPGGRRIALVAALAGPERGGPIWIVEAAGGKATLLTQSSVAARAPAFAPDGRRVAFFAPDSAGHAQVWVQELAPPGSRPRRLTDQEDVVPTRVRWTPDGTRVVYSADGRLWSVAGSGGPPAEIPFTIQLSVERPKRSLPQARFPEPGARAPVRAYAGLALSPDGRAIGMIALGRLWVMPVDGAPRPVVDVPRTARFLAWSADGARVAWSAGTPGNEDLYATRLDAPAIEHLTRLPGREVHPAFSPDGRHLAFVHAPPRGPARLRVVDATARDLTDPAPLPALDSLDLGWTASDIDAPQWTPSSDGILRTSGGWSSIRPTVGTIVRLSGERRSVARMPDSPLYLHWTGNAVTFIRHARLWRAPFDSTGLLTSPEPLGTDPAMYASAATDGTLLYISEDGLRLRAPGGQERHLGWPLSYTPPVPDPLVIRNTRIIDGTGGPVTPPRDILVERGRITRIAATGTIDTSARRVLDAGGRFIMPGLMDLHAHEYRPDLLPGFVYYGVTTIRDQGSLVGPLVMNAEAIAAGLFAGPRVAFGGFQLYTDWAWDLEDGLGVEPEADSGHAVRSVALAQAFGAQHIKTRTFRRWDINARMVAEAHRRGMRATGHCAYLLPLVAAGMDAQEHAGFCDPRMGGRIHDDLVQLFRAAGIGLVPTIAYGAFAARLTRADLLEGDAELAPFLAERSSFDWMVELDTAGRRMFAGWADQAREVTRKMARAGVTIGTGTDVWQVPSVVHDEMRELVAAGLSPLEAIKAATSGSARILGAEQSLGTIAEGMLADLVLLDADPTADIANTTRIRAVVQGGRVVDRLALRGEQRSGPGQPPR